MILTLAISGYRSIRDLVLPLDRLTVVTGANGVGKSSLYRALRLLAATAEGRVIATLAQEGGLPSTLWAGPEKLSRAMKMGETPVQGTVRKHRVSLQLGFASEDYGYAIDLGLPTPDRTLFGLDPEIKAESVWVGETLRPSAVLAERMGPLAQAIGVKRAKTVLRRDLPAYDSLIAHAASPHETPELVELRERMRRWRFYDHLRTDRDAPARAPQIGTRTPVLADGGDDVAAALQTIREIGDPDALDAAIDDAFPGSRVEIDVRDGYFEAVLTQPGVLRPLRAAELSDGTLRYLLLTSALLSPRPPSLMVLNEPETSLHGDLLAPLARLILRAAEHRQAIVVSHAGPLVDALTAAGATRIELIKELGETQAQDIERPRWSWPKR